MLNMLYNIIVLDVSILFYYDHVTVAVTCDRFVTIITLVLY